ncbi:master DNA invertase Mpi family serine-type recombinase [Massilibacteroides sp.]|uniref:master DNA invertase Mpi family serine-type recombinase n=1 Tax=Massilibacteroides sp. TaxID=2034766 RepID=UPI00342BBAE3
MIYGYVRVSTDKQTVENQRYEINEFVKKEEIGIDSWIEETVSGSKEVDERKLGYALQRMNKGDVLICAELSRLGRNLLMIMGLLNQCMRQGIQVWTIKDNYRLGNDISSKVLAFAFGLSAEIERNLISQRTKEALARRRSEGKVLGRPKGSRSKVRKLTGKEGTIEKLLEQKISISMIARKLKVHRLTVTSFIKDFLLEKKITINGNTLYLDGRIFFRHKRSSGISEWQPETSSTLEASNHRFPLGMIKEKLERLCHIKNDPSVSQLLTIWHLGHDSV